MKRKPPQWQRFDRWVVFGALVGLGVALGVFCTVHFVLYGNFAFIKNMRGMAGTAEISPSDMLTMTATVLGGLTVGGAAVMQYRKHKWGEYTAKLDEDSRTGERLSSAIEHLGNAENEGMRISAIYELKRLADDSERDREAIGQIMLRFIHSKTKYKTFDDKENPLPRDVDTATHILGYWADEYGGLIASGLYLEGIWLKGADLANAHLRGSNLTDANLEGARLSGANLERAWLKGANLNDAYLKRAYLELAQFENACLKGAMFMEANLEFADFRSAFFSDKTLFFRAWYDDATKFDSEAAKKFLPGMRKVKQ